MTTALAPETTSKVMEMNAGGGLAPGAAAAAQYNAVGAGRKPTKFQPTHANKYGLRVTARAVGSGVVECLFCSIYGRDVTDGEEKKDDDGSAKKRKRIATVKAFTTFETSNYKTHLEGQHKSRWSLYQSLDTAAKADYLKPAVVQSSKVTSFFDGDAEKMSFYFEKDIIDVLVHDMLLTDDSEEEDGMRAKSMAMFLDAYAAEETDEYKPATHYRVQIKAVSQFKLLIRFVARGCSFRMAANMLIDIKEVTGLHKLGFCNDNQVSKLFRIVCAVNFQRLRDILKKTWAFAIAFDMASHLAEAYLDVRIRLSVQAQIHDLHLMLIPIECTQTGENMFQHMGKALDVFDPKWKIKMIGVTSDGTSNNTGRYEGAVTKLIQACKAAFGAGLNPPGIYRHWCVLHQIDIFVGSFYQEIIDGQWVKDLTSLSGHMRRQYTLIQAMSSTCPKYVPTRWLAMERMLRWLLKHRARVMGHYNSFALVARHESEPTPLFWVAVSSVFAIITPVALLVKGLQGKTLLVCEAKVKIEKVVGELCALTGAVVKPDDYVEDGDDEETLELGNFTITQQSVIDFLENLGFVTHNDLAITKAADEDKYDAFVTSLGKGILKLIDGMNDVEARRTRENVAIYNDPDACLPQQLAKLSGVQWNRLMESQKLRCEGGEVLQWEAVDAEMTELRSKYTHDKLFKEYINGMKVDLNFELSWASKYSSTTFSTTYPNLVAFAGGLAAPFPATATAESDFSTMRREKNEQRQSLTNFALEGQMQCQTHLLLQTL